ncbi:MAG: zinc ribbon domain-containing protein [Burkholderiaceae bacterium]|nr:zinc ribbon domain-containing protein [Burkholderiaceae bacterium]
MPTYDYHCASCGDFREIRPMSESRTPQPCPDCGGASERLLSAPFLARGDQPRPAGGNSPGNGRVPWRTACGLGCSHAH